MTAPWTVHQLAEFLTLFDSGDGASFAEASVDRVAEALDAEFAAFVLDGSVEHCIGVRRADVAGAVRGALAPGRIEVDLPGIGRCETLTVPVDESDRLIVARAQDPISPEEESYVRACGRALTLTLRMTRALDSERAARNAAEAHAAENTALLTSLRERQSLNDRLFKIQQSISHRAKTGDVLDAITAGAGELLDASISALRLVGDGPTSTLLVSSVGIEALVVEGEDGEDPTREIGEAALIQGTLVIRSVVVDDRSGETAAMAAPVHRGGEIVGSLVVAAGNPDRSFSAVEEEVLLTFAEHASLALNDASAVDAIRSELVSAKHDATHDDLTGLPNRPAAIRLLGRLLDPSRDSPDSVTVFFLDLDRFKAVNDVLGHAFGDEVLREVAARLRRVVRDDDLVARLAGDEFVVISEGIDGDQAEILADRLSVAVAEPLSHATRETVLTASIGLASARSGDDPETVLSNADVAMYRAKQQGRDRVETFDQEMRRQILDRINGERELRAALEQGQLCVYYQPSVRVRGGRTDGLEALVRWQHPGRGLLGPDAFIALAEDSGHIRAVDTFVLTEACRQVAEWRDAHPTLRDLYVTVNVSARQFTDPNLVDTVRRVLEATGLPARCLWLEITETVVMGETETTLEILRDLRDLGVHLMVDDFGTGYSSLSYLKRFPVDALKIDRSFVDGLGVDPDDEAIVTAIVGLAQALDLGLVGEGVETELQQAELLRLGVDHAQGYLYARPMSAPDVLAHMLAGDGSLVSRSS